jgi:hypothetical protein
MITITRTYPQRSSLRHGLIPRWHLFPVQVRKRIGLRVWLDPLPVLSFVSRTKDRAAAPGLLRLRSLPLPVSLL